jgi:hypothetical protein
MSKRFLMFAVEVAVAGSLLANRVLTLLSVAEAVNKNETLSVTV